MIQGQRQHNPQLPTPPHTHVFTFHLPAHKTQDHRCIKLATREHGFGPQVAGQVTWWLPKPSKSHKGHSAVTPEMGAWFSLVVFLLVMGRVCEARYFLHVVYISLQGMHMHYRTR
ncbi:hypothetical protein C8R41DRAFT_343160 [Lentinula lateritia]|uniref:Uncharacterized protein n=1 Tax=Lentinula lateritia TaxID=40482 RepID=A0ABQ8VFI4_9AGAR|nr:hypothetical protein C8R41DRAFT_343160 [Lentinula lateritia]